MRHLSIIMVHDGRAEKICMTCGRPFSWRKKWEKNWAEIRFCSAACRGKKKLRSDGEIAALLQEMARERSPKTLCPSEVARRYAAMREDDPQEGWRRWMEPVRAATRRLVAEGCLEVLQKNRVIDAATMRGPVRIRCAPQWRETK